MPIDLPLPRVIGAERTVPGSINQLIVSYLGSTAFADLAPSSRKFRRAVLERLRLKHGGKSGATLEPHHIEHMLRGLTPAVQRNFLKTWRGLFVHAMSIGLLKRDPTRDFKPSKLNAGEFTTWTEEQVVQFEAYYPWQSRERLALTLMAFTGAARCDVVTLGRQHIKDGVLRYARNKTGERVALPVHPDLAAALEALPKNQLTFLVTAKGTPFTDASFGMWFGKICKAAGLDQPRAHGLRKLFGTRLANNGATPHQIMAALGHRSLRMAEKYTRSFDRERLAAQAVDNLPLGRGLNHEQDSQTEATRFAKTHEIPNEIKEAKETWRPRQDSNLRPTA